MQRSTLVAFLPLFASCTDDAPRPLGGAVELSFDDASGNVDTSPLPATDVQAVFFDAASQTRVIGVLAFEPEVDGFRRKAWQLALSIRGDVAAGATYTIGTDAALGYEQSPPGDWRSWDAASGSIAVESVAGTSATFSFESVPMTPTTRGNGNEATGTFMFSGTITVDTID